MRVPIFLLFFSLSSLLQGIAIPPGKNIKKLDLQVRKKRLIDRTPGVDRSVSIAEFPYVVSIIENGVNCCVGSILSPTLIISAAHCVFDNANYGILSNSSKGNYGIFHSITSKIIHQSYHPLLPANDLVLLEISPAINFRTSVNDKIPLFNGTFTPGSHGTISGWGCHCIHEGRRLYPDELRSITVPIISLKRCRRRYYKIAQITEKYVCTYFPNRDKCCDDGDSGAPLVVSGQLLGVMTWSDDTGGLEYPDVFVSMLYWDYRVWIESYL